MKARLYWHNEQLILHMKAILKYLLITNILQQTVQVSTFCYWQPTFIETINLFIQGESSENKETYTHSKIPFTNVQLIFL